ncbi:hypothetical protein GB927_020120 [Shinella sp. CPCC 100929]|uniref:DUF805 domain-containing protein n=1 Tax=Shinella lacus TaxID=2654216 RepID=A0ABT1RBH4_9HYPH|nr:hypothetical protein [Shinella lacus]
MGAFSVFHWLIVVVCIVNVFALWRLLPRSGIPNWVGILGIFPPFAFILLWIVSFKKWPSNV